MLVRLKFKIRLSCFCSIAILTHVSEWFSGNHQGEGIAKESFRLQVGLDHRRRLVLPKFVAFHGFYVKLLSPLFCLHAAIFLVAF